MADTNRSRIADFEDFAENDPFAELTRIMGHDPRPQPARALADEDFEIDLENELLGDLADVEGAETRAGDPAAFTHSEESSVVEDEFAGAMEAELDAPLDLEDDFVSAFDEFEPDVPEGFQSNEAHAADRDVAAYEEPEISAYHDIGTTDQPETASNGLPEMDFGDDDLAAIDADFGPAADLSERSEEQVAAEDQPFADFDWSRPGATPVADDAVTITEHDPSSSQAESDPDAAFLSVVNEDDEEEGDAFGEVDWQQEAIDGTADVGFDDAEPLAETGQNPAFGEGGTFEDDLANFSGEHHDLEEELTTLLSGQEAGTAALSDISANDVRMEENSEEDAFDYSLAASDRHDFLSAEKVADDVPDVDFDLPDDFAELGEEDIAAEAQDEPEAVADEGSSAPYIHLSPPSEPYQSDTQDVFAETFDYAADGDEPSFPEHVGAAEEAMNEWSGGTVVSGDAAGGAAAVTAHMPEIETVEVPDHAVAMADDLDIPELDLAEDVPPASEFDDLETELAGAFGEMPLETVATADAAAALMGEQNGPVAAHQIEPAQDERAYLSEPELAAGYAAAVSGYHGGAAFGADDDIEFDQDGFDDVPLAEAEHHPREEKPSRRGLLIAAAVAGVAVIGGIGAFALSFGDSGSSAPAVVQASDEPFKVKPENPGGTKVVNQNNEVYRRASGMSADDKPAQERLVTTTEEPIDVAARAEAEPRIIDAAAEMDEGQSSSIEDVVAKSDDRLDPVAEDSGIGGEVVAVTPHKVRTLVVRPDGTMVPAEMPEPASSGQLVASASEDSAVEAMRQPSPSDGSAAPNAPSAGAASNDNPLADAAPVPTARPANTPAAQPPQQREEQPQQVASAASTAGAAAAASAPVTSAPTSKWSVQISSQPTAESAQQSYQDLARRYGELLSGRGVNIVKADIAGKGTYYRVRVPSSSKDDAIALCSRLKSAGGSCFVSQ